MPSRTFAASDGRSWTVWLVQPTRIVNQRSRIPQVWLAFQNEDESERRRLREFPADWATLSDERLELLRCTAEVVKQLRGDPAAPGARKAADQADVES